MSQPSEHHAKGLAETMLALSLLPLYQHYLEDRYQSFKTRESYLSLVRPFLVSLGPSAVIAEITPYALRKHITEYAATRAPASVACCYAALHTFVKWLVEEGYLAADPMAKIKPPKPGKGKSDCLTREEMQGLIAACIKIRDPYRVIVARTAIVTLAGTGIRCSELLGLRLEDVNWQAGTIFLQRVKGGGSETRPVSDEVLRALRELKQARTCLHAKHSYLFSLRPAAAMVPNTLRDLIREVAILAGYRGEEYDARGQSENLKRFHPHALRHGFISTVIDNGGNIVEARDLAGHKSVMTTNRYAHGTQRGRDRLNEITALERKTTAETQPQRAEAWTERRRRLRPV